MGIFRTMEANNGEQIKTREQEVIDRTAKVDKKLGEEGLNQFNQKGKSAKQLEEELANNIANMDKIPDQAEAEFAALESLQSSQEMREDLTKAIENLKN